MCIPDMWQAYLIFLRQILCTQKLGIPLFLLHDFMVSFPPSPHLIHFSFTLFFFLNIQRKYFSPLSWFYQHAMSLCANLA